MVALVVMGISGTVNFCSKHVPAQRQTEQGQAKLASLLMGGEDSGENRPRTLCREGN